MTVKSRKRFKATERTNLSQFNLNPRIKAQFIDSFFSSSLNNLKFLIFMFKNLTDCLRLSLRFYSNYNITLNYLTPN